MAQSELEGPFQDYTGDLRELATMVTDRRGLEDVLERALDALQAVVPYDLAAVFRLHGDSLFVVAAAGPLASARIRRHGLALRAFPTLRRALEVRRPIPMEEHHHDSEEGDPYDGVLDLPHGHSCMVVPLFAGDRNLGIITLDRTVCGVYQAPLVDLAGVYGQLISLAMLFGEQAALLDRYRHQLKEENRLLQEETGGADLAALRLESSQSPLMRQVARLGRQVAAVDLPVLIQGETGTGKEVVAQAIHSWSPRVDGPFIKLNCSAIPESLAESELFGHVKGAFSGADRDRRGRFLTANGGTLLLDEIGDMPLSAQSKLLRVLQEGTFEPLGSDRTVKVDVRVLAATHIDLMDAISRGRFREDLYYRLAAFPLRLPPLRERREDIAPIAIRFLEDETHRTGRGPWRLTRAAVSALEAAPWPGNVRELINALERATILQPSGQVTPGHLGFQLPLPTSSRAGMESPAGSGSPAAVESGRNAPSGPGRPGPAPVNSPPPTFVENERHYFETLLSQTGGRIYGPDGAAALAGLKPTTLRSRLLKLGLR